SLMGVCVTAGGARLPVGEVVWARSAVSLLLCVVMLPQGGLEPWGVRAITTSPTGMRSPTAFTHTPIRLKLSALDSIHRAALPS
ncbi:MAG: hypothetical protein ACKOFN_08220, partial [Vulcanococcus sp.]